jgi:hypothetical protein
MVVPALMTLAREWVPTCWLPSLRGRRPVEIETAVLLLQFPFSPIPTPPTQFHNHTPPFAHHDALLQSRLCPARLRDGRLHVADHPHALQLEAQAPDLHLGEPRHSKAAVLDKGMCPISPASYSFPRLVSLPPPHLTSSASYLAPMLTRPPDHLCVHPDPVR